MNPIEAAELALVEAKNATRRARHSRDVARDMRIQHASIPGYTTALDSAEVALLAALENERSVEAELASTIERGSDR